MTFRGLTFTFVTDRIERAVNQATCVPGDKSIVLLGASIDQQSLAAGLVDEMVIHVAPILLGDVFASPTTWGTARSN